MKKTETFRALNRARTASRYSPNPSREPREDRLIIVEVQVYEASDRYSPSER